MIKHLMSFGEILLATNLAACYINHENFRRTIRDSNKIFNEQVIFSISLLFPTSSFHALISCGEVGLVLIKNVLTRYSPAFFRNSITSLYQDGS
jgi:hypothetical protein